MYMCMDNKVEDGEAKMNEGNIPIDLGVGGVVGAEWARRRAA